MLIRRSLFAVAVATFGLAAAGSSYAGQPSGVDLTKKPKNGQVFTKPGSVSNSTTPSGGVSNSGGIVAKPAGFDPNKIVTKSGGNNSGGTVPKPPSGFDPSKTTTGQGQGKGGGIGNGNCGHPGQPACKIGGVEHCKSGVVSHGHCAPYPKVIVINKYPHYVPVYQNRYVPVPTGVVSPVVSTPAAPATCLTKEYLQADLVMFKDTCAKQWAMNTTTVAKPVTAATARTCLTKEDLANDTVLFKDICSGEWAKNPKD
jgi:hypothetical protein